MQLLFIGDIVGRSGRKAAKHMLIKLKEKHKFDLIVANGENLAGGKGMTEKTMQEMQDFGIDFFTSGNHIWHNKDFVPLLDDRKMPVLRPANYPDGVPGRGYELFKLKNKKKVLIINLMGRTFMNITLDCPFRKAEQIIKTTKKMKPDFIMIDFHAEATSEKSALLKFLDGQVSAIFGTHTHIQTNDAYITKKGTAFISDAGAVYARDSIIGVEAETVLHKFLTQLPATYEVEQKGLLVFNAVRVKFDNKSGQAVEMEVINELV